MIVMMFQVSFQAFDGYQYDAGPGSLIKVLWVWGAID